MEEKILGLDIGIASVGHGLISYDDELFEGEILSAGSRIFDACEVAKTKEPINAKRREARLQRRRLSRRKNRLKYIKKLFIQNELLNEAEINNLFYGNSNRIDVWNLRKEALTRKLNVEEFYRIIHQIAKRRGFKSIRKSEEAKNQGSLLKGLSDNKELFIKSDYQTIGEMFATLYTGDSAKRNKRDEYKNSIPRELLQEELKIIFEKQRELGLKCASREFEEQILNVAFYQRPLQSMKDMIGYCEFEKDEKRAPKASYTAEMFVCAQKLVNVRLINYKTGEETKLNKDEIGQIIELAHKRTKVTYKQARKELFLEDDIKFKSLNYKNDKDPENNTLIEFKKYHEFKKAIIESMGENYFEENKYNKEMFDNIAEVLTYEKSDELIEKALLEKNIPDVAVQKLKELSASKVLHLSIKAMEKITPFLLEGYKYNEACALAGYDFKNEEKSKGLNYLPPLTKDDLTTNPVVNRAISQTRKVVNALIRKYGKIDRIIIETARDLGKSAEERNKIKKGQEDFQKQKEQARKRCIENNVNPDLGNNLLRFRLWEEQDGRCIYSRKRIDITRLSEPNYTDIDHIIPYSRSFDDSLNNKVLCLSDENRQKGNKIPYEYLNEKINWFEYSAWVESLNLSSPKTTRILKKSYMANEEGFISRNLNDTRYMSVFIKDYLKNFLNCKVETRNGSLTAFLRNQWGIKKVREENDKHHAIDAIVLSCSTKGMVKYLSTISAKRENYDFINNSKPKFKRPWKNFLEDIERTKENIFVSRAVDEKINGSMHKETIKSSKHIKEGFTVLKKDIKNIKLSDLENLFDKERNSAIYYALKERLEEFENDPKKAFSEPVYMPLGIEKINNGQTPHQIKSIKIMEKGTSGVILNRGFADNDSMVRTDVFTKVNKKGKKEYFLVPVYVVDFARGIIPNRAIKPNKPYEEWVEIDDTFNFEFSLYKNTLISINKTGNPSDEIFGYYNSTHRGTGAINIEAVDGNKEFKGEGIGVKSLFSFKKYQVDPLGNYFEVKHEKRLGIIMKKR